MFVLLQSRSKGSPIAAYIRWGVHVRGPNFSLAVAIMR